MFFGLLYTLLGALTVSVIVMVMIRVREGEYSNGGIYAG